MINFETHPELRIISAIDNRPEMRPELVALNENLFIDHKGLFTKWRDFVVGKTAVPGFTPQELRVWLDLKDNWEPFVSDSIIDDLKRHYIDRKIKDNAPKTKKDVQLLLEEINNVDEDKEKVTPKEILEDLLFKETKPGVKTGIPVFDRITKSLSPGHLWVIGGYTSVGKTNIALRMAENVAEKHSVIFYSTEMTQVDMVDRIINSMVARGLTKNQAIDKVAEMNIMVYTSKVKMLDIETHIAVQKEKPDVVFVDFIQNVDTEDKSEYERLTNVSRNLQRIALKHKLCVVALSQVSNDSVNNKRGTMGFKGSGAIAAACDVGIELFRDKEAEGDRDEAPITCRISKNRHGRTCEMTFDFNRITNVIDFGE